LGYKDQGNPHALPVVMWLKSGMEKHSALYAEQVGLYEREARFYRYLQPHLRAITPKCFYSEYSTKSRRGVTLIGGLQEQGARLNNATKPMSVDNVSLLLEALAQLHRRYFESDELAQLSWIPIYLRGNLYWNEAVKPSFLKVWLDAPRASTYPRIIQDENRISVNLIRMASLVSEDRLGLIHGDAHIGNSYILGGRAGFYDWQCIGRASPIMDVAYCVGSALNSHIRREHERQLLRDYLGVLNGDQRRISEDDAWLAYRRYMIYGLWAWMINPEHIHPEPVNVIQSNRFANAVADLETFKCIEEWS